MVEKWSMLAGLMLGSAKHKEEQWLQFIIIVIVFDGFYFTYSFSSQALYLNGQSLSRLLDYDLTCGLNLETQK